MVTADQILRRRVQALLDFSGRSRKDLSLYMGKQPSWATDFFTGRHSVNLKDLDRLGRFFGVSVPQLFEIDGYRFRDRRRADRRVRTNERRVGNDRRKHQV